MLFVAEIAYGVASVLATIAATRFRTKSAAKSDNRSCFAFCHTDIKRDISAIDVTKIAKPPTKRSNVVCCFRGSQQTDDGQHWLPRLHRKRPRCRNATDKTDKFAPPHARPQDELRHCSGPNETR